MKDSTNISGLLNENNRLIMDNITIENIMPSDSSNLFETLIPIITLFLGFFLGKLYDSISIFFKLRREGKVWFETLLQLVTPLEKQVLNISTFIENSNLETYGIDKPQFQFSLNCKAFDSLNDNSLIPFFKRKRGVSYRKSLELAGQSKNTVSIVRKNSDLFLNSFNIYSEKAKPFFNVFSEEFQVFRKHMSDYVDEIVGKETSTETESFVADKLTEFHNTYIKPSIETDESINIFIISKQMFPEVLEVVFKDRKNLYIEQLIGSLTKCDQAVKNIKMERKNLFEKLNHIKGEYSSSLKSIEEILGGI